MKMSDLIKIAPPIFYIVLSNYLLFAKQKKLKNTCDVNIKDRLHSIPIITFNYVFISVYSGLFIHITRAFPNHLATIIGIDILLKTPIH